MNFNNSGVVRATVGNQRRVFINKQVTRGPMTCRRGVWKRVRGVWYFVPNEYRLLSGK